MSSFEVLNRVVSYSSIFMAVGVSVAVIVVWELLCRSLRKPCKKGGKFFRGWALVGTWLVYMLLGAYVFATISGAKLYEFSVNEEELIEYCIEEGYEPLGYLEEVAYVAYYTESDILNLLDWDLVVAILDDIGYYEALEEGLNTEEPLGEDNE